MKQVALGSSDGHTPQRRAIVLAALLALGAAAPAGHALAQANSRNVSPAEWAKIQEAAQQGARCWFTPPWVRRYTTASWKPSTPTTPASKWNWCASWARHSTAKIEQERLAPNVAGGDMMLTADIRWAGDAVKKGYLKTPVGPAAAAYPDAWMRGGQVALMAPTPWVIHYNTNLVKTPITGYQDLLVPELAGKVGGTSLVAEVVTLFYKWVDETNPGFMEKFAAQKVKMYPSTVASANSTASVRLRRASSR